MEHKRQDRLDRPFLKNRQPTPVIRDGLLDLLMHMKTRRREHPVIRQTVLLLSTIVGMLFGSWSTPSSWLGKRDGLGLELLKQGFCTNT